MTRKIFNQALLATSALIGCLSVPCAAYAAPQGASADGAVGADDEIIVNARRRDESAQDVPLTVNAVTSQALDKLNIRDLKDVQSLVPGLALTPDPVGIAPVATLRGVNYDTNNSGSNGTVQFYFNDAPISSTFVLQSIYDVGQIEVLRGPQGTLRGIAAPSGSVTLTSRKPDLQEFGGYVNATANTIGGINVHGALNLPIIKDKVALRVAGIVNDDEANRVHSINNPSFEPSSRARGERVTLRVNPTDNIEIVGTYQHLLNKVQYYRQVESAYLADPSLPAVGPLVTAASIGAVQDRPSNSRENYHLFNAQAQWKFAGQKLNFVANSAKFDIYVTELGDIGHAFDSSFPGTATADPRSSPNLHNYGQLNHTHSQQNSYELRLSSDQRLFGFLDYTVGGLINRLAGNTDLVIMTPIFVAGPPAPASFFGINQFPFGLRFRSLERSLFGNVTAHLGEKTEISGGVRFIHFNTININRPNVLSSAPVPNPNDIRSDADFKTAVFSASVKHRFNENIMAYASVASSWRASVDTNGIILALGGGNTSFVDPALAATLGTKDEKSKSYEVGVKTDWLDKRLKLNLTYYHQVFDNYIFSSAPILFLACGTPASGPVTANDCRPSVPNSGISVGVPVKVDGVEAEFSYQPSRAFNIAGIVSYSLGKIINGTVPCNGPSIPVFPKQVNFCPVTQRSAPVAPFGASVQTEYNHAITDRFDGFLRGQMTYYGKSQNDPANLIDDIKAYAMFNLFAGVRDPDGAWEITAFAKNLFNAQRVLSRAASPLLTGYATFSGGGAVVTNYRQITYTAPREFGINLRYSFGSR